MKGCHSCPFKLKVDAGEYENTPWEKVPCSTCDVLSGSGFAVEFDETRSPVDPEDCPSTSMEEPPEPALPLSVMRSAITGLMTLKPELRDVVSWRYLGLTYPEIADRQRVTVACVEKRHRRAMELWPALQELFPEKVAKKKRRKPHSKRSEARS